MAEMTKMGKSASGGQHPPIGGRHPSIDGRRLPLLAGRGPAPSHHGRQSSTGFPCLFYVIMCPWVPTIPTSVQNLIQNASVEARNHVLNVRWSSPSTRTRCILFDASQTFQKMDRVVIVVLSKAVARQMWTMSNHAVIKSRSWSSKSRCDSRGYVKQEAKIVYLLECLPKTPPPVLIFCENKADVDDIHEYLLLKGVDAVAIHGGKDQEEREYAISSFKAGKKDVLVATDVASKGLDFPDIQHVINYNMPAEMENYVHRIGRTGRCGKTVIATTFINKNQSETTLLDLKHLLQEAKQRIPPVLAELNDPMEDVDSITNASGVAYLVDLGTESVIAPS
ncbi:hypothetical protein CsSME_00037724 [Camellia sinensis var. sinensis]